MNDPLLRLIQSLSRKRVKFLVVGGMAAVLYGVERATFDLDILVSKEDPNLQALLKVLKSAGFRTVWKLPKRSEKPISPAPIGKIQPRHMSRAWALRFINSETVDVLLYASEKVFNLFWKHRRKIKFRGIVIPCPHLRDLISLKRWAGRPRDLYDLNELSRISNFGQ